MKENLKGCSITNYGRDFEDPVEKVRLNHVLGVLEKFGFFITPQVLRNQDSTKISGGPSV